MHRLEYGLNHIISNGELEVALNHGQRRFVGSQIYSEEHIHSRLVGSQIYSEEHIH
jgi:hypothetical protein